LKNGKILIMVPTYNECQNAEIIATRIRLAVPNSYLLFIDDNSPDGTGQILDSLAESDLQIMVIHRPSKLGVGSAHLDAIFRAYKDNFSILVTLDGDLTHSPENIQKMISSLNVADVVTSTRFLNKSDLDGWSLRRKLTTHFGHLLTRALLRIPYDSSSGFRAYNLENISEQYFRYIKTTGYSFFFESLKILDLSNIAIAEVPMSMSPRTHGSSKMTVSDIAKSVLYLCKFSFLTTFRKQNFKK